MAAIMSNPEKERSLEPRILSALIELERDGCQFDPDKDGVILTFSDGIPCILLRAWVRAGHREFARATWNLERLGFIRAVVAQTWPYPKLCKLRVPDGRLLWMRDWSEEIAEQGGKLTSRDLMLGIQLGRRQVPPGRELPPLMLVRTGILAFPAAEGQLEIESYLQASIDENFGRFYSITSEGLAATFNGDGGVGADTLVTLNQAAALASCSKRNLERYLHKGELPPPDCPGGDGLAHKWWWNTLREPLSKLTKRLLPERFPASRIP